MRAYGNRVDQKQASSIHTYGLLIWRYPSSSYTVVLLVQHVYVQTQITGGTIARWRPPVRVIHRLPIIKPHLDFVVRPEVRSLTAHCPKTADCSV